MGEHFETFGTLVRQLYVHGDLVGILVSMEGFDTAPSGRWRGSYPVDDPLVQEFAGPPTTPHAYGEFRTPEFGGLDRVRSRCGGRHIVLGGRTSCGRRFYKYLIDEHYG